jgi:Zn-finger nucleic acid-binding protein
MRPDLEHGVYVCDYCGGEFVPPPEADGVLVLGVSAQECPICARHLSDGSLETHSLRYCTGCHGMLIAMEGLMGLVEALRSRRDRFSGRIERRSPLDAERHLRCPSCGSEMDGHPYGGGGNVNVDSCEKCDLVWLDGGELRRIVTARDHDPLYGEYLARKGEGEREEQ